MITPYTVETVSGGVTKPEIAAILAVAQDHAFGQAPGAQLRATVLAQDLGRAAGCDATELAVTWWTSALRFLGCTGHAYETAVLLGDEIEFRARTMQADISNPLEVMRLIGGHAGSAESGVARVVSVLTALAGGRKTAELNFRTACEVADVFGARLGLEPDVRNAIAANFERWNGRGLPNGLKGTAIPRPMRIAQISQELEVLARSEGIVSAIETVRARRGKAYDPVLTDLVVEHATQWWSRVEADDPWDAALRLAPPSPPLSEAERYDALVVLADFADLKSPWLGGHSRGVAALVRAVCGRTGEEAALVHDLGRVAVPNTIWDKRGHLTRDERDRAEVHALVTEQLLRRVPALVGLAASAGAAHERVDGSGYYRRVGGAHLDEIQRTIAAADCYQAMTSDRPHRAALDPERAAAELRSMSSGGLLDGEAVERVLAAAGHRPSARPPRPAGLTAREIEVLRLLALGLTIREVADRLVISVKTADRHAQNIYPKIGVSTRGAAALFAIEQGVLVADG